MGFLGREEGKGRGLCPLHPHQGRVVPGPPSIVPLFREGAYSDAATASVGPLSKERLTEGFQGRYALGGVQGQSPWPFFLSNPGTPIS